MPSAVARRQRPEPVPSEPLGGDEGKQSSYNQKHVKEECRPIAVQVSGKRSDDFPGASRRPVLGA